MYLSADLCRSQESYHHDRAAGAQLENVRLIAEKAATAWGQQALAAERREARHARPKSDSAGFVPAGGQSPEADDRQFSENPDRGFESE